MGKLVRSKDWLKTPLGSPDTWPQNLRTTVSIFIYSNILINKLRKKQGSDLFFQSIRALFYILRILSLLTYTTTAHVIKRNR